MSDLAHELARLKTARAYMVDHGIKGSSTNAVVVSAALERGFTVEKDRWERMKVSDGSRSKWFYEGRTGANHRLLRDVAKNKDVAGSLLRAKGIRAPENAVFTNEQVERAWAWAQPILPVVLKPCDGKQGQLVHVDVSTREEFTEAFARICEEYDRVLVEQFVTGVEHRFLVVDNKVAAVTCRVPANVVGNGVDSVETLVKAKNRERRSSDNPVHSRIKIGPVETKVLQRRGMTPQSVPADGEVVHVRLVSNLHGGGDAVDMTEVVSQEEIDFVEAAAKAIPGLRLAGFDVLLPRDGNGTEPYILEMNTSPMISLHHFPAVGEPRDAAGAILDAFFKKADDARPATSAS